MPNTFHNSPRLRTLLLAAALCVAPLAALATPSVSLTAMETLGAPGGPGTNVMTTFPPGGGDFFRSNAVGGNSAFFHTYGFGSGLTYFGARTSGTGTFFSKTSSGYNDSITNNSGVAQLVLFSFNVDSGQIGVSGTGTGYADLLLNVMFNGVSVAREHGRIDYNSAATSTCNVNDLDVGLLGNYLACSGTGNNAAFGSAGAYSVSQLLADGATLNVAYDIVAEISGSLSGATQSLCSGGDRVNGAPKQTQQSAVVHDGKLDVPGESGCVSFNSIARSGDPAGFGPFSPGSPGQFTLSSHAVPEPGSLPLAALGIAIGALTVARRRRMQ